jgi:ankyrin repeat protein
MRGFAKERLSLRKGRQSFCALFALLLLWTEPALAAPSIPTHDLMLAAAKGDAGAIAGLVALGADPNAGLNPENGEVGPANPDSDFSSALTISVFCGCVDVTRALLSAGARPTEADLVFAIALNQPEIARTLLNVMTTPQEADLPFIPLLTKRMSPEASTMFRGFMVRQILTGQVPEDAGAMTWAQIAAVAYVRDTSDGIFLLLDALIARGFGIDATHDGDDGTPQTAREIAGLQGDVLLARGLASRGAALPEGWTNAREKEIQLVGAATVGNQPGVALLLRESVSPNGTDLEGNFALAAALEQRNVEIAEMLLNAGANPRRFGATQASPLTSAARLDQTALVGRLIDSGAVADQLDGTGSFALQAAAREGATRTITELLAHHASPGFVDAHRRTALHELIEPDEVPWGVPPSNRPLNAAHLEAVRILGLAGLPFGALDDESDSVLASNLGHGQVNLELVHALLAAGARPTSVDLSRALEFDDPGLLRTLLRQERVEQLPAELLLQAANHLNSEPALAVALLEHGVQIPADLGQQRRLLIAAAGAPSEIPLGLLLSRGVPLTVDPEGEALEAALANGRPKSVALLAARGVDLHAKDSNGRTALHRYIVTDASGREASRIDSQRRAAITALVDAGFVLATADREGKTASSLAQAKASTSAALNQAIAAAGANAAGIHGAIRSGRLDDIRRMAADPAVRETRDVLGRTPLSFALQSGNWAAARILLRAGALISFAPAESWQPADATFAGERAIAGAFAVRLLSATLVDIPADRSPAALQAVRRAYQDGRTFSLPDFTWRVRCQATGTECGDGVPLAGNKKIFFDLLESFRFERGLGTAYGLIQRNLRSIHLSTHIDLGSLGGPGNLDFGEVTFLLTGTVVIPRCTFSFENPSCSPGIRIHNPNTDSGLSMLTDSGYERLPTANLRYTQANGTSGVLAPDESTVLDRSVGPITLEMDEVRARVFSLRVEIERMAGEDIQALSGNPSTANRMAFYTRLAQLHRQRTPVPANTAERVSDKTLASTIAALSAEGYLANYPTVVLALLRQQADVIANLDLQVRAIQNAVLAQATYTPAQIDVLVAQIDAALANPATGDPAVLRTIRSELIRLRASAEATGVAVNELRNTLFTDADLYIELYQALVLEYRQYVPSSALDTAVNPDIRQSIAARVSGREVLIGDAAAGGTGRALRASFGLPDPRP